VADELDFGVNLDTVRDRLAQLNYFTDVQTLQDATLDLESGLRGIPPLAYVSTTSETAEPNRLIGPGSWSQRVTVTISAMFCIPAERADEKPMDEVERTRRAVTRILVGWTPDGAESPLQYYRFLLRGSRDGLIWGEVLTRTVFHYRLAS
jgi:hypothetical protein